ncbi:hypothetical protein ACMHYB_21755 [Sorangium sp. So ce1128]
MRAPTGFVTPVPRRVRGPLCAAGALASEGGASGAPSRSTLTATAAPDPGFVGLLFGGFGDDLVALAAGTRDTTAARHDECGASTPDRRSNG